MSQPGRQGRAAGRSPAPERDVWAGPHPLDVPHCPTLRTAPEPTAGVRKWAVFALISVGTFMTTLDSSIVNISLPAIARSFHTPLGGMVEWVLIAYLLVIAATLLTFGRLADLAGRERVWVIGIGVFTVGSLLCGIAPSLPLLIVARALQGVGGALIFAPAIALVVDAFPRSERGRALGLNAVIVSLGISTGPTLGGLITEHLSWRWIFFVNLPLGVAGVLVARRVLPFRPPRRQGQFDPPGALAFGIGLAALCLGLSFGREWGWASARFLVVLLVAAAGLVAAVAVELRRRDPLVDVRMLASRVLGSALLSFLLSILALFAVSFLLPFYFEQLRGFDPLRSGLLLTPYSLALAVVAPLSGTLADRIGSRWLAPVGLSLACAGLLLLAQIGADSSAFDISWRLALSGIGQGLFLSPNTRTVMGAAAPEQTGIVSGLVATTRVVGQSLSVAVAGAVFTGLGGAAAGAALAAARAAGARGAAEVAALEATFLHALRGAIVVCGALAALGIFAALVRGPGTGDTPR